MEQGVAHVQVTHPKKNRNIMLMMVATAAVVSVDFVYKLLFNEIRHEEKVQQKLYFNYMKRILFRSTRPNFQCTSEIHLRNEILAVAFLLSFVKLIWH